MEWSSEFCRKRHPTDDLKEEQPLTKRLSLLNLNNGFFPPHRKFSSLPPTHKRQRKTPHSPAEQERMEVDNVIYISDLESDSDSDTEQVIFIPEIEKKLNQIPYQIASRDNNKSTSTSTELVLYSVPSSISVPETKDVVKRAIIESRQRLREKSFEGVPSPSQAAQVTPSIPPPPSPPPQVNGGMNMDVYGGMNGAGGVAPSRAIPPPVMNVPMNTNMNMYGYVSTSPTITSSWNAIPSMCQAASQSLWMNPSSEVINYACNGESMEKRKQSPFLSWEDADAMEIG